MYPGTGVGAGATISMHVDCLIPAAFMAWIVNLPQSAPEAFLTTRECFFPSWTIS